MKKNNIEIGGIVALSALTILAIKLYKNRKKGKILPFERQYTTLYFDDYKEPVFDLDDEKKVSNSR